MSEPLGLECWFGARTSLGAWAALGCGTCWQSRHMGEGIGQPFVGGRLFGAFASPAIANPRLACVVSIPAVFGA